jgi:predicted N-acetyltransferase YhbS
MMNDLTIRPMALSDLNFAMECIKNVGWIGEVRTDFEIYYEHDPQGCLIAEVNGSAGGICIATSYGDAGFIGDLIVLPDLRGKGIGARLLNRGVEYLQHMGAKTVYLEGGVKATPLYERNGFRKIERTIMFTGTLEKKEHSFVRTMHPDDLPDVLNLDRRAFGADRSFFLQKRFELFPHLCKVLLRDKQITGYITCRRGENWAEAGPWVVDEQEPDPFVLLESLACSINAGSVSFSVLESNTRITANKKIHEFLAGADNPWHMVLGEDQFLGKSRMCCALGNLSKG